MIQSLSFYILFIYFYNINNTSPSPSLSLRCKACIVLRLGGLLALGFGEAGAEVIGQNMKAGQKSRHDDTTRHDTTRLEWDGVVSNWGNPRYPKISQDIPRYSEIQRGKHHHFPFDCYLTLDFDAINRSNPFWVSKPERSDDPNGLPRIASGRNSTNLPSGNLT